MQSKFKQATQEGKAGKQSEHDWLHKPGDVVGMYSEIKNKNEKKKKKKK